MGKIPTLKKLFLIDATSLIYRAFYALPEMSTKNNIPTNAIYGISLMLLKLLKEEKPDYIVAAFDSTKPTFRHKKYIEYKIQRKPTPEKLIPQIELTKELFSSCNIKTFSKDGFEADDIIGTFAKKFKGEVLQFIISGDKDLLQIVDENIFLITTKKGITETVLYDIQKIQEQYKITPQQLIDYKALVGDVSDNIKGVNGIGEKTAILLLKKFQNVENLLSNIENYENEKIRLSIISSREKIIMNKDLVKINTDIEIDVSLSDLKRHLDIDKIKKFFEKLNFASLIKKLNILEEQNTQLNLL